MTKSMKLGTLSIVATLLLIGCGSGSSSSDDNQNNNQDMEKVGHFIDSAVEGLRYKTSSGLEGVTDSNGRFRYKMGDEVSFSIGNLNLGETTPANDGLVTPESLSNGDEELKLLLLRTLQALDVDDNPSNGITIPVTVTSSLSQIEETSISDIETENELLTIDNELSSAIDEDFDGVIDVDDAQAESHFRDSQNGWTHGNRPEDNGNNGNYEDNHDNNSSEDCNNSIDINSYPLSTLNQELKDAIAYMGNEERLAYDVYHNLFVYHSENGTTINQLQNISERSEVTHVGLVQDIVQKYTLNPEDLTNVTTPVATRDIQFENMPSGKYGVPAIQSLYDALYAKGVLSTQDALEVGCMVEVTDVNDLDEYIALADESNAQDIKETFEFLRDGSYSHYWAFDKGLKNLGVNDGCCSLGTIDGVDYCQPDYPQNDHSQESSNGNGNGHGHN